MSLVFIVSKMERRLWQKASVCEKMSNNDDTDCFSRFIQLVRAGFNRSSGFAKTRSCFSMNSSHNVLCGVLNVP